MQSSLMERDDEKFLCAYAYNEVVNAWNDTTCVSKLARVAKARDGFVGNSIAPTETLAGHRGR